MTVTNTEQWHDFRTYKPRKCGLYFINTQGMTLYATWNGHMFVGFTNKKVDYFIADKADLR